MDEVLNSFANAYRHIERMCMTSREIKRQRKQAYRNYLKSKMPSGTPIVLHDSRRVSPSQTGFFEEIIVDNFAGGGGASTGIELAASRPVAIAINHDRDAILLHKTNHPYTEHLQASVWDVDPVEVCRGRPVGLKYCGYDLKDDEVLLLIIRGTAYYIEDITLRMLTPRELYNAMGFPEDYVIDRDYQGNEYKKTKQVARCGNAVCPPLAYAMVWANFPEWRGEKLLTMASFHDAVAV